MTVPHSSYKDAIAALIHWEDFGFPRKKEILGLPFYGRDQNWAYYGYDQIIQQYHPAPDVDEIAGIHFNGIHTIQDKTKYVMEHDYGGIMIWEVIHDTTDNTSLLITTSNTILQYLPPDFNCDQRIDLLDLYHLINQWLLVDCENSNAWCSASDLDQSNIVNLHDFALFSKCWMDN